MFYSQHGEDQILAEIFKDTKAGTGIEVGAYDGVTLSNTYYFEQIGWRTLLIEPAPDMVAAIKQNRKCRVIQCAASSTSGEATFNMAKGSDSIGLVSTLENNDSFKHIIKERSSYSEQIKVSLRTMNDILQEEGIEKIDFITIDVEGHELDVLKGFDLKKWKPRIVILEDNTLGVDNEIPKHMGQNGYLCFKKTHCNYWYAQKSDKALVTPWRVTKKRAEKAVSRIYRYYLPQTIKRVAPPSTVAWLKEIRNKFNLNF